MQVSGWYWNGRWDKWNLKTGEKFKYKHAVREAIKWRKLTLSFLNQFLDLPGDGHNTGIRHDEVWIWLTVFQMHWNDRTSGSKFWELRSGAQPVCKFKLLLSKFFCLGWLYLWGTMLKCIGLLNVLRSLWPFLQTEPNGSNFLVGQCYSFSW